tara:strand:- start:1718 stop:2515 length:798 start_codon:yes stop_codon:yes gene_type:complete
MKLMSEGEVDLYLNEELGELEGCVVLARPEYGAAAYVAASGIVDLDNPVGRLISKYHYQDVFNHIPDLEDIGWPIYKAKANGKEWLILIIDSWRPLSMMPGEGQNTWIYSYPVIRDFTAFLQKKGVDKMCYLSSTSPNDSFPPNVFPQPKRSRTYEYHFGEGRKSTAKAFLLPPTWLFPHIFSMTGGDGWITFTGFKDDIVDELAAETLGTYLKDTLGFKINRKTCERTVERIREEESDLREVHSKGSEIIEGLKQTGNSDHMWG